MSLPRYPEYKDSGVEWLGDIPSHWSATRINALATLNDETLSESTDLELEIEYVDIGSVSLAGGIERTESLIFSNAPSRARRIVRDGDVLVSTVRTYLKAIAPVISPVPNLVASTGFAVVRPKSGQHSGYLKYGLQVEAFVHQVIARSNGVSYPAINASDLARIPLWTPPFAEQRAIASFLDRETAKIDALIAEQEKLLALLAEKRQVTISHAVTRGLDPNVLMKDSGIPWLGEVPAHWRVTPLKYLVSLRSGGTPSKGRLEYWGGNIPWASAKDLKTETLLDTTDHLTQHAMESGAATLLPASTVLVVVRGMILARMFPVTQALVPMAINQDLKGVLPRAGLDSSFLPWLLRGTAGESLQRLDEAGHGTKALRMEAWTSIALPVPPQAEQVDIAAFLAQRTARLDALAEEACGAIELMRERRSALIAAAVTGQIDVRGEVVPEAA